MFPIPAVVRMARLTAILETLCKKKEKRVSSSQLALLSGYSAHTIRKDINYLGNPGENGAGYETKELLAFIRNRLNLEKPVKTIIVGLGKIGGSLLHYSQFMSEGIEIVAGFDSSINRIEQMPSAIPLYPSYEIETIAQEKKAELGVIAVPQEFAQKTADRMVAGGIKGILNFSNATINVPDSVLLRTLHLTEELMLLASMVRHKHKETSKVKEFSTS